MILAFITLLGLITVWTSYVLGGPTFFCFLFFYVLSFLTHRPRRIFSPLSIFYAYYGLWFIVAPLFATRYIDVFYRSEYNLAIALAYSVFSIGVLSILTGIRLGVRLKNLNIQKNNFLPLKYIHTYIFILYIISTLMIVLIILSSGGFTKWILSPGDAFLERSGSGVYVILSHFSSITLAALVGFLAFHQRKIWPVIVFTIWVLVTSPVHGSKLQISLLIVLALLPWLRTMKLFSVKSGFLYLSFIFIFFLGLSFRSLAWGSFKSMIEYSLNYFTTLENLAISLRDFSPQILKTFFLPFVKFQTPFGLAKPDMYYDMNHYLTDIYVPSAWQIRATEQWPVETDLYLNFMFFGGLPIVAGYLAVVGFFYGRALRVNSLGHWTASLLMSIFLTSHLRGSLYNHVDFYMYPFILILLYFLKDIYFKKDTVAL